MRLLDPPSASPFRLVVPRSAFGLQGGARASLPAIKKLEAIIKPFKLGEVKEALGRARHRGHDSDASFALDGTREKRNYELLLL
jgi:hypothetical protein